MQYFTIKKELGKLLRGEIFDDNETLKHYSRDASLFEVWPKLVIWPQDKDDLKTLIKFIAAKKSEDPTQYADLSLAVRAAGSCMSGGSLSESIVVDVSKHLNHFSVDAKSRRATVEPGVFYRDFEPATLQHGLILPCYTASKNLCALGGMIGNNSAGEKTLRYGKMENFVEEVKVILANGEEHTFKPETRVEILRKIHEHNFVSHIYDEMSRLLEKNRDLVKSGKPQVSKNSAGYYLWNIERNGLYDFSKLIVGSQGTLGIVTEARLRLEPIKPKSKLLVIFLRSLDNLGDLVNIILPHQPESLESYDDDTLKLAVRFLPEMLKVMKTGLLKLAWSFLPELGMTLKGGIPKLVLLVEFAGGNETEIDYKIKSLEQDLKPFHLITRPTQTAAEAEKYWAVRRESFNLLRKHVRGRRTAPFIDDICVNPASLPLFLPKLRKILDEAKLTYTIAGHAGNGNFHIIPLMDMKNHHNRAVIPIISEKVYDLVREFNGSITAEHNDGLIRTPFLHKMYSPQILELFRQTKAIFDPQNIFNPGKKIPVAGGPGTIEYLVGHLAKD